MATKTFSIFSDGTVLSASNGIDNGNVNDNHLPIGLYDINFVYYFFRAFLKFNLDFSDVISITKAELYVRTSDGTHVGKNINSVLISRCTSAFNLSGGSENNWSGNPSWANQPSVTSSGQVTRSISKTTNTWNVLDITAIVQAWKDGSANHGLRIKASAEAYPSNSNTPVSNEIRSSNASASAPYILLTYVTNTAPTAPTLSSPAAGAITLATPTFVFNHNDADADPCAKYDLQVSTDSTFASVTHWNDANDTSGIVGNTITRAYGGTALTRGTTYYWRARTNDGTVFGAWSAARSFIYNRLPTVTKNAPTAATLGVIHNIADLALWSASEAKPQMKFTPSDADGQTITKYQLRIYDAAAAGNMVFDSGQVAVSYPSGVLQTVNVDFGIANGTERWWTIDVYDGMEWAGESSRTAFKLRWSQGLYEFNTGSTTTTNWSMLTGVITQTVSLIFRGADTSGGDAATGKTAFFADIASVPAGKQWVQILVRLTTATAGSGATLDDMTFNYYGTPSLPDGWTVS